MQQQPDLLGFNAAPRGQVHRLFFALWPDDPLRQRIADATAHLAAAHTTHGRRVRPERYHLTLQFLGDFAPLPQSLVDDAVAAADGVRVAAFELPLDRAGGFGGSRVGWLAPTGMPVGLLQLWDALGRALARHGVTSRSPATLTPHVTVLRDMRQPLPAIAIAPLSWPVGGFVLIHSQPGQGDYAVLRRWPLQA